MCNRRGSQYEPLESRCSPEAIIIVSLIIGLALGAAITGGLMYYFYYHNQLNGEHITSPEWNHNTEAIDRKKFGEWQTIVPSLISASQAENIGMQTVHTTLLPSGKVVFASGSSWRNKQPTAKYPEDHQPEAGTGLFNKTENPFEWEKADWYYSQINSVGLYDPDMNNFFRIPHPLPIQPDPDNSSWFLPTDLFCTGHQHVPDGNVLFFGGTQFYAPQRTGTKTTHLFLWTHEVNVDWTLFDWTKRPDKDSPFYPWKYSGTMHQGRWYPHAVPLLDGRLVIFGGYIGFDSNVPDMYPFEMNHHVEFFDYQKFLISTVPEEAWVSIDVQSLPGSPFNTPLPTWPPQGYNCSCWPSSLPQTNCSRQCEAYRKDAFKLYPNNYLMKDGRIYLTREGDWNSLRNFNAACIRRTAFTYFMSISGDRTSPTVTFSRGQDRLANVTISGTTVLDPNSGNINLYGGMTVQTGGTMLPSLFSVDSPVYEDDRYATQYAGSRGSRKFEMFTVPKSIDELGEWTLEDENYLGENLHYDRTMHYATLLPTKQILIINGGNYDFYGPVYSPLLLTPIYDAGTFTGNYTRTRMAPGRLPRLYHNIAILLPDARVLVGGGNACRATLNISLAEAINSSVPGQPKPNLRRVDLDLYWYTDGQIGAGHNVAPAEVWTLELFLPPYLFLDGDRRPQIISFFLKNTMEPDYTWSKPLKDKMYYLIKSNYQYQVDLAGLPEENRCASSASLVLIKLGSTTHGWDAGQRLYSLPFQATSENSLQFSAPDATGANIAPAFYMMFYVDCVGIPSVAMMVRFDDHAREPF